MNQYFSESGNKNDTSLQPHSLDGIFQNLIVTPRKGEVIPTAIRWIELISGSQQLRLESNFLGCSLSYLELVGDDARVKIDVAEFRKLSHNTRRMNKKSGINSVAYSIVNPKAKLLYSVPIKIREMIP